MAVKFVTVKALLTLILLLLSVTAYSQSDSTRVFDLSKPDSIQLTNSIRTFDLSGGKVYVESESPSLLTDKKAGVIVRYASIPSFYKLMDQENESVTIAALNLVNEIDGDLSEWQEANRLGMDVGLWTNTTNSAFAIDHTSSFDQSYFEALDASLSTKGIQEFKTYDGLNYCLQNVVYPDVSALSASQKESINFSTNSGGSNITATISTVGGNAAVYIDSTKSYAVDFPHSAWGKWFTLHDNGNGTYQLQMNGIIPLQNYCDTALKGSHAYTSPNQLVAIKFDTYYPNLIGFKYNLINAKKYFSDHNLPVPTSLAEVESGGYPKFTSYANNGLYNLLDSLGFTAATRDPLGTGAWVNMKSDGDINRFRIYAASTAMLSYQSTIQAVKERIADFVARNQFVMDRATSLSSPLDSAGWKQIIDFCQLNDIPILSYKNYAVQHFDRSYDVTQNIFPRLYKDIAGRNDSIPDGFTNIADSLKFAGGVELDSGYFARFNNLSTDSIHIIRLGGFERGDNAISFWAKNDGSAYDIVRISLQNTSTTPLTAEQKQSNFYIKSAGWRQYHDTVSLDSSLYSFLLTVPTYGSSGNVDISGIEIKGLEPEVLSRGYEPESEALFARMLAAGSPADNARKVIIDSTIKKMKHAYIDGGYVNLWRKAIAVYAIAAHSDTAAKLNWKENAYNLTTYNSPSYVVDSGWAYTGTNDYLGTGFNPYSIADSVKRWNLYDACLMLHIIKPSATYNLVADLGARPTKTSRSYIAVNNAETTSVFGLNSNGASFTNSVKSGMFGVTTYNNVMKGMAVINGVNKGKIALTTGQLTNGEFLIGCQSTVYTDKMYSFALISEGLTPNEMIKVEEIFEDYYLDEIQ